MNQDLAVAGGVGGAGLAGGLYLGYRAGVGNSKRMLMKESRKAGRMATRRSFGAKASLGLAVAGAGYGAYNYSQGDIGGTLMGGAAAGGAAALAVKSGLSARRHRARSANLAGAADELDDMGLGRIGRGGGRRLAVEGARRGGRVSRSVARGRLLSRAL